MLSNSASSYSDLVQSGLAGLGLRGRGAAAVMAARKATEAAAAAAAAAALPPPPPPGPLDLGSVFARELGFDGLAPYRDPLAKPAAAKGVAPPHVKAGPGGGRSRTGSSESAGSSASQRSVLSIDELPESAGTTTTAASPPPAAAAAPHPPLRSALVAAAGPTFSRPPPQGGGSAVAAFDLDNVD